MKKIRLIAIDVDGTLVNTKKEITPAVKQTLMKARREGKRVVICTGRPLAGAQRYLDELNLNEQKNQYVVSFNGAVVENTAGKVLFEKGLSYEQYIDLESLARKVGLHFHAVGLNRIYTANRDLGHYTIYNSRVVKLEVSYRTPEEMAQIPIIKCMYVDEPKILDQKIKDPRFKQLAERLTLAKTEPFYYEANAAGIDKGSGLKILCQKLGVSSDEVMALGDQANDIPMLTYAGIGVAMGNAVSETKKAADLVTDDCDHDGAAKAISKIL